MGECLHTAAHSSERSRSLPLDLISGNARRGYKDDFVSGGLERDPVVFVGNLGQFADEAQVGMCRIGVATGNLSGGPDVIVANRWDSPFSVTVKWHSLSGCCSAAVVEPGEHPSNIGIVALSKRVKHFGEPNERVRQLVDRQLAFNAKSQRVFGHVQDCTGLSLLSGGVCTEMDGLHRFGTDSRPLESEAIRWNSLVSAPTKR